MRLGGGDCGALGASATSGFAQKSLR
jgi:hypothetical protein